MTRLDRKAIFGWSMYDWANSAFATTVMAGFFPVFFKQYWSVGADATLSTARLGLANSIAGVLVAMAAPSSGPSQTGGPPARGSSSSSPPWASS